MIHLLTSILTPQKLPLLLHAIIESAAASTFILNPSSQLPPLSSSSSSSSPLPPSPSLPPSPPESASSSSISRSPSPLPPYKKLVALPTPTKNTQAVKTTAEFERDREIAEINLILLNYGGLLLTTNLLCLVFILRQEFDEISELVCLCVATYHVWPIYRAGVRIGWDREGGVDEGGSKKKVLGGPVVHLAVHVLLLGGLVWSGRLCVIG